MAAAYLDSNVFDHLYKKIGCTSADIANLRARIYSRELSVLLSIHTLEKILLDRAARPELLVARTKLTLSLGNFRRMVKPCQQLFNDDLRAYASMETAVRPFIDTNLQNIMTDGIAELVETDGEDLDEEMITALEKMRSQKARLLAHLRNAIPFEPPPAQSSFEQYFSSAAPTMARNLASFAGVAHQCEHRSIDTLLEARSVRMSVGATLSVNYAQLVEHAPISADDAQGLLEAVSAAAVAPTFVTDNAQLRRIISRVPLDNFSIVDLPTFLKNIAEPGSREA
jgi:hypothetical protein